MDETSRRTLIGSLALGGAAAMILTGRRAQSAIVDTPGPRRLPVAGNFPGKGAMIVQRQRAPLLETPFEVFDQGVFTPNDRFFVRWHYADIPLDVDAAAFRLRIDGAVTRPLSLSLADLLKMPRVEINAVNQCSGNSRGRFTPPVPGGQWGNGAMGNARWTGVRLKDVLDRAGVRPGAQAVRCAGLDRPPEGAPWFAKSITIDHARDGEVMIAFAMNGTALPVLNGFPLRLVVPGWYSTYWIKALDHIEIMSGADDNFWMAKAYKIPTAAGASVPPGTTDFPSTPISTMVPRSFVTSHRGAISSSDDTAIALRGIAMGGASGVRRVELSLDGGPWRAVQLGMDHGRYSFRRWTASIAPPPGDHRLAVRCTNMAGETQSATPIWNPGGYMLNTIETYPVHVA